MQNADRMIGVFLLRAARLAAIALRKAALAFDLADAPG
jgi:hypothetical protein